jgi:hypothetical protein
MVLAWLAAFVLATVCFGRFGSCFNNHDDWEMVSRWAASGASRWGLVLERLSEHTAIHGKLLFGLLYEAFGLRHAAFMAVCLALHAMNGLLLGLLVFRLGSRQIAAILAAAAFICCSAGAESVVLTIEMGYLLSVALATGAFLCLDAWLRNGRMAALWATGALASVACLGFPARVLAPVALGGWLLAMRDLLSRRGLVRAVVACVAAPLAFLLLGHLVSIGAPMGWAHATSNPIIADVIYRVHVGLSRGLVRETIGLPLPKSLCEVALLAFFALALLRLRGERRAFVALAAAMLLALYGLVAAGRASFPVSQMEAARYAYLPSLYLFAAAALALDSAAMRLSRRKGVRLAAVVAAVVFAAWLGRQAGLARAYVRDVGLIEAETSRTVSALGKALASQLRAGRPEFYQSWLCSADMRFSLPVSQVISLFDRYGVTRVRPASRNVSVVLGQAWTSAAWREVFGLEGVSPYLNAVRAPAEDGKPVFDAVWPNRAGMPVLLSEIAAEWFPASRSWSWTRSPASLVRRDLWPKVRWAAPEALREMPEDTVVWPEGTTTPQPTPLHGAHPSVKARAEAPGPPTLYLRARLHDCSLVTFAWRLSGQETTRRWLAFRPAASARVVTYRLDMTHCPDFHGQPVRDVQILFTGVPVRGEFAGLFAPQRSNGRP